MVAFKVIVKVRTLTFETLRAAARHFGINERLAQSRKQEGWTPEQICGQAPSPSGRIRRSQKEINKILSEYSLKYDSHKNNYPLAHYGIGSKHRAWWRCDNCKQSYPCGIDAKIRKGAKCPICRELPLQGDEFPALREIFCEADNGLPLDAVVRGTHRKYWFQCTVCGDKRRRVFKSVVAALKRRNPGCAYCYRQGGGISVENDRRNKQRITDEGSLADHYPEVANEWDYTRNSRAPQDYLSRSGYDAHWVCIAGHKWKASISSRVGHNSGCRKCGHHISQYEKRVVTELQALGFDVAWNERLHGVECDVLLKKQKLVIEVDGFPWHETREAYHRERK